MLAVALKELQRSLRRLLPWLRQLKQLARSRCQLTRARQPRRLQAKRNGSQPASRRRRASRRSKPQNEEAQRRALPERNSQAEADQRGALREIIPAIGDGGRGGGGGLNGLACARGGVGDARDNTADPVLLAAADRVMSSSSVIFFMTGILF